jgi:hypothetical protein
MTTKKIYVLVIIELTNEDSLSAEPVGVYTDLHEAIKYSAECQLLLEDTISSQTMFDVFEFSLDDKPPMLSLLEKTRSRLENQLSKTLIKLMKRGLIDQLIGEDGHFYYILTKEGEKIKDSFPEDIKKHFRKNANGNND